MFYSGMLLYFKKFDHISRRLQSESNTKYSLLSSNGTFGFVPKVDYLFGFPRSISGGHAEMDLDSIFVITASSNNDTKKRVDFAKQLGMISSTLEHDIPENLFKNNDAPVEGVSAVKALTIASMSGQKILRIDKNNYSNVVGSINLSSSVVSEINNAVNAGRVVTTHTDNISVSGWTGAGYIISDPETGSAAYKIEGGLNGSNTSVCDELIMAAVAVIILVVLVVIIASLMGALPALIAAGAIAVRAFASVVAYVAQAVSRLPAAAQTVAGATLFSMIGVSGATAATNITEVCVFQFLTSGRCWYLCPSDGNGFDIKQPENWCGEKQKCPSIVRRP